MNRPIIYSLEEIRSFDTLWGWRDTLYSIGYLSQNMLGLGASAIQGFVCTQSSTPNLTIQVGEGWIYALAAVDSTTYGALPADATQIMQQGYKAAAPLTFTTAALSGGQALWALVQVGFAQVNDIRAGDPNAGLLPYINVSNPNDPFQGPNNSGTVQNTERQGTAVVSIKYGTPATSGTEVPPTADAGFVPYRLVNLVFGQTTISTAQILLAGPAAYSGYASAPYFPGVIGQIPGGSGSHHGGIAGQAQKIVFTNGLEIQGIAPYANLPVSNTSPPTVSGIVTVAGDIPIMSQGTANPNGSVAGFVNDMFFDNVLSVWYICVTSGNAAGAVWSAVGAGGVTQYINTSPYNDTSAGNFTYLVDTSGGAIVVNLPLANAMGGTSATFINIGSNSLTITPQAGETIGTLSAGVSYGILPQNTMTFAPRSGVGWYLATPQLKLKLVAKSANFSATDPSGTLYQVTAATNIDATLPTSPADGTLLSFQLTTTSVSTLTFLTSGADTIISGGTINGPGSTNPLFLPGWQSGVVDLCAVAGGWIVK